MGLFSKKEKKTCPICGKELSLFTALTVADGEICESCESRLRGQFDIEEYWKRKIGASGYRKEDYKLKQYDPLKEMTIAEIQEMIDTMNEEQATIIDEMGGDYSNIARASKSFNIAPKALDVGLKRAKELKNRVVVTADIVSGEFCRGDEVEVVSDGGTIRTKVLDAYDCSNSSSFETILNANSGKHKVSAGVSAWLLLDIEEVIPEGTVIRK